jgi:hypothetical protein
MIGSQVGVPSEQMPGHKAKVIHMIHTESAIPTIIKSLVRSAGHTCRIRDNAVRWLARARPAGA